MVLALGNSVWHKDTAVHISAVTRCKVV